MLPERSVDYLLVAEFDIDKGPTLAHQYPSELSSNVTQLAELMLPDQMHVRTEDWTIFFLRASELAETAERPGSDGHPLYVLNLVTTKHDTGMKRGAQVRALAIVTRHSFLQIFKPILLLAIQEYSRNPVLDTLAALFDSVNSLDLSEMPLLTHTERLILLSSDREDLFSERFGEGYRSRSESNSSQLSQVSERLTDFIVSPSSASFKISSPTMPLVKDTHFYNTTILYNGTTVPIKVPLMVLPEVIGEFSLIDLIQIMSNSTTSVPIHAHLTPLGPRTPGIMIILNALLLEKRVVFLGHNRPSGEVASHVLAACAMVAGASGLLRGFTDRAFPYTDLSKIDDLLELNGFIAGTTNSIFELHPEWWDILCNTETGQITISSQLRPASSWTASLASKLGEFQPEMKNSPTSDQLDLQFVDEVNQAIADHASETSIRLRFRDFIYRFIRTAASYEYMVHGSTDLLPRDENLTPNRGWVWSDEGSMKRDILALAPRIEVWRTTESYRRYTQDIQARANTCVELDLWYRIESLRSSREISTSLSREWFIALNEHIQSKSEVHELLSYSPSSAGGVSYMAQGLFHPDLDARRSVLDLLGRIKDDEIGRTFYEGLMRYHRTTYARLIEEQET